MTKSVDSSEHPSSSHVQKEIEQLIVKAKKYEEINSDGFQIDGALYDKERNIIELAEIHVSQNPLKGGRRHKVVADVMKLLTYKKCKSLDNVKLKLIVISDKAHKTLTEKNGKDSWIKEAISKFHITVEVVDLDEIQKEILDEATLLQSKGNILKEQKP